MSEKTEVKEKVGGIEAPCAFLYAVTILFMTMKFMEGALILFFRVSPDEAWIFSFLPAAFLAGVGFRGVKAIFKLKQLSK